MPLIEELPVTNPSRVSHGWAYVPDVAQPIASMAQPNSRKRQRNDIGTTNATATAKQQKAVQQRLESLGRENWKDGVSIPIPPRQGGKERKTKMTTNVRRILNYQKGFMHYLADEEAATALNPGGSSATTAHSAHGLGTTPGGRGDGRKHRGAHTTMTSTPAETSSNRRRSTNVEKDKDKDKKSMAPPTKTNTVKQEEQTVNKPNQTSSDTPSAPAVPQPKPPYDPSYDTNPLLRTLNLPKKPSDRVLQILVTEPPLSYTAARAKALPGLDMNDTILNGQKVTSKLKAKPVRHFCAICGYWGKVKCRKCGEWTCGIMECWKGHESVCVALGMY